MISDILSEKYKKSSPSAVSYTHLDVYKRQSHKNGKEVGFMQEGKTIGQLMEEMRQKAGKGCSCPFSLEQDDP